MVACARKRTRDDFHSDHLDFERVFKIAAETSIKKIIIISKRSWKEPKRSLKEIMEGKPNINFAYNCWHSRGKVTIVKSLSAYREEQENPQKHLC